MSNPSKSKGTAAETAIVRWLRNNGYPTAERRALSGNQDKGDILAGPGLVIEVKNRRGGAGYGQPGPSELGTWMAQAAADKANARADLCPLIVKRVGTTDVGKWWLYLTAGEVAFLLDSGLDVTLPRPSAPLCMSVADGFALLRVAGYGDEREAA